MARAVGRFSGSFYSDRTLLVVDLMIPVNICPVNRHHLANLIEKGV
jgi:hypothetical protein